MPSNNSKKISEEELSNAKKIILANNLFDKEYYNTQYPEVSKESDDLLEHYLNKGYKEGRNPSELFDNDLYIEKHDFLKEYDINPLVFHVLYEDFENNSFEDEIKNEILTENSISIDEETKIIAEKSLNLTNKSLSLHEDIKNINNQLLELNERNVELNDKLRSSVDELNMFNDDDSYEVITPEDYMEAITIIRENNLFDEEYYNNQYPWIADGTSNLFNHYLTEGYKEGRDPSSTFNTKYYISRSNFLQNNDVNPLIHYAIYGIKENKLTNYDFTPEEIKSAISEIKTNNFFDEDYYYKQHPALKKSDLDPFKHYLIEGYKSNLNPNEEFDTLYYKEAYLNGNDINPLIHYMLRGLRSNSITTHKELTEAELNECIDVIYDSNTFDVEYYMSQNPGLKGDTRELIKHYVQYGAFHYKNPNKVFDTKFYREENKEVLPTTLNPYYHYLTEGSVEERKPSLTKTQADEKLNHEKLLNEYADVVESSELFDEEFYLETYDDVKYTLKRPAYHYVSRGYIEGKNPSRYFDNNYYLYKYPEVREAEICPLYHYITEGRDQGNRCKQFLTEADKKDYETAIEQDVLSYGYTKYDEDAPLISIILLNRNGVDFLEKLLGGFNEKTDYPNYELIIIDNDSSDESVEIIKKYKTEIPIILIENKINKSYADANNDAVSLAKGQYLLFLNNDIELLDGWLNHLIDTALTHEDVGAIGARLVYPDSTEFLSKSHKSYKLQHTGKHFKGRDGYIQPYDRDNAKSYLFNDTETEKIAAVSSAVLLIEKAKYEEVGGFDAEYRYGFEDVDLCLKLNKQGYANYYNPKSVVYHHEHGILSKNKEQLLRHRQKHNIKVFTRKWHTYLKQNVFFDKLNKKNIYTEDNLKIACVIKHDAYDTGNYISIQGLFHQLELKGYETQLIPFDDEECYNIEEDIDVLISLVSDYDLDKIKTENILLMKLAVATNDYKQWVDNDYFENYDVFLSTTQEGLEYIRDYSGYEPLFYPIISKQESYDFKASEELTCDYCLMKDSDELKGIGELLNPDNLNYTFNIYGDSLESSDKFHNYNHGLLESENLTKAYVSTKLVVDYEENMDSFLLKDSVIFNALVNNSLVITNNKQVSEEVFGGKLPVYDSKESLESLLKEYLSNSGKLHYAINELQQILLENEIYQAMADALLDLLKRYIESIKVMVKLPIKKDDDRHSWGDYHFAILLVKAFNKQENCFAKIQLYDDWDTYDDTLYDIALVLRGLSKYTPKSIHYNIMWNISHPDLISIGEYDSYNQVYIASLFWAKQLKPLLSTEVEGLLQCTDLSRFHREVCEEYETELLFVGQFKSEFRKILRDLLPTDHQLSVYGGFWEGIIDEKYIKGDYFPNEEVNKAYSSTKVLLNDHWDDMRKKGFISNRIFDGLACGAVIVSDHAVGLEDVFGDEVIIYDDKEELPDKINEALEIGSIDSKIIKNHTFDIRAEKMIDDYKRKTN